MILVTSVLNGCVLRANMEVVVQERRVNGRVLILKTMIHEGRMKGKVLESGRLEAVSVRIEGNLVECAWNKLRKGRLLVELIPELIEVGHLVYDVETASTSSSLRCTVLMLMWMLMSTPT